MKALVIAVGAAICITSVHARNITGAQIVEFGVFRKIASEGYLSAPNSAEGKVNAVMEAQLTQSTSEIRPSVGVSFGIRFKLVGTPENQMVKCSFRWLHPKITDPATKQVSDKDEWEGEPRIGHARYVGYTFDHEWELMPGAWTIQVLYDGKVVAEKTFKVSAPRV